MATDREYAALTAPPGRCGWTVASNDGTPPRLCGATSRFTTDAPWTANGEVCGIHNRTAVGLGYTTEPIR